MLFFLMSPSVSSIGALANAGASKIFPTFRRIYEKKLGKFSWAGKIG